MVQSFEALQMEMGLAAKHTLAPFLVMLTELLLNMPARH